MQHFGAEKQGQGFFAQEIKQITYSIEIDKVRTEISVLQDVLKQPDAPSQVM